MHSAVSVGYKNKEIRELKTRQILFTSENTVELMEREVPPLGPHDLLCRTVYTAISQGTERANMLDMNNTVHKWPKALGYCAVSRVEDMGAEVEGFKPGDRVLVYHGVHADHVVRCDREVYKIEDDSIDDRDAAFVIVGAMGLGGLRRLRLEAGESAAVFGLGVLGISAVMFARLSGGLPVIAVDFKQKRRSLALSLGADYAFSPSEEGFTERVRDLTRGGVHAAVEVTGSAKALDNALDITRRFGRVSLLGCTRVSDCFIDFYRKVHCPGITLYGAHNMARGLCDSRPGVWTFREDVEAILNMLSYKRISFLPILADIYKPGQCKEAFSDILSGKEERIGLLFDWR